VRFRSTLAGLAAGSVMWFTAASAHASDIRWATTLEGDAMQGATLDGGESAWFPGLTLDGRLTPCQALYG